MKNSLSTIILICFYYLWSCCGLVSLDCRSFFSTGHDRSSLHVHAGAIELHHSVLLGKHRPSTKPSVLVLHGLLGSSRNFQSWSKLLSRSLDNDRDIICLDLRNHGRSVESGEAPLDYKIMAEDVKKTMDYLGLESAHIVGHSMGAKVAAAAALHEDLAPRILSLVMLDISPVQYELNDFLSVSGTVETLVAISEDLKAASSKQTVQTLLQSHFEDSSMVQFLLMNMQPSSQGTGGFEWKFNVHQIHSSMSEIRGFPYNLDIIPNKQYPGKVLIIKAGNSSFVRSTHLALVSSFFPSYVVVTVRECGHWLHIEKPSETVSIVSKFLNSI
eukprot:gene1515-2915_t